MEATQIIANQTGILFIACILGYIAARQKVLNHESNAVLAKIILKITLPAMLFSSIASRNWQSSLLREGLIIFALAFIFILLQFLFAKAILKLLKLEYSKATVFKLHHCFGNVVFIGFPLLDALFPNGRGLFYAACYQTASEILLWSLGIITLNTHNKVNIKDNLKHLLNINTLSFFCGALWMSLHIPLPGIISGALLGTGHATAYLAMIYIGALFYDMSSKSLLQDKISYLLSFNKLLLFPIAATFIMKGLISMQIFQLSFEAFACVALQTAMPAMTVVVMLARQYQADDGAASRNVFLSTLLSIVCIPLVLALSHIVYVW
jgi:predicted permease